MDFLSDDGSRRVGTHTAGIRALVIIEKSLVVLAGSHRNDMLAVNHYDEACFFAG